ncbi:MAG: chemotaxis protein CheC [Haloplanus sp.]
MKVDVHALETFNRLAHDGAEAAAASLTELTGIGTSVDVTQTTLMDRADLGGELRDGDYVGVQIGFEGQLAGETVLVFERNTAASIVDVLVPDHDADGEFDGMARSGIVEVGNIMVGGFVDGWADYLGSAIDITPPSYVERSPGDGLELDGDAEDHIFVFESQLELVDERVDFYIYMLPEYRPLMDLLARQDGGEDEIPVDKLAVYNQMVQQGAHSASEHVSTMTGVPTTVDVSKLSFVPVEDIPSQLSDKEYVGTVFRFSGLPSGYLVILFDESSGITIGEQLIPTDIEEEGFSDQHQSAIRELGNIMTSGFVDGWANVLETTVEISTPQFVHDLGPAIMEQVVVELDRNQHEAFLIGSRIRTEELDASCDIFAIPEAETLRRALSELSVERAGETEADPTEHF